ncbi:unnamed protein product [Ambrosiozyma monospora]|uniref:Unnamed protein product n=1 Tax=Ambrosiozyma monospora TaxID=43982 RepID=A0ACB5T494_AMBMO|nr:unnamed protein product [Ambrosiozyma monospora]
MQNIYYYDIIQDLSHLEKPECQDILLELIHTNPSLQSQVSQLVRKKLSKHHSHDQFSQSPSHSPYIYLPNGEIVQHVAWAVPRSSSSNSVASKRASLLQSQERQQQQHQQNGHQPQVFQNITNKIFNDSNIRNNYSNKPANSFAKNSTFSNNSSNVNLNTSSSSSYTSFNFSNLSTTSPLSNSNYTTTPVTSTSTSSSAVPRTSGYSSSTTRNNYKKSHNRSTSLGNRHSHSHSLSKSHAHTTSSTSTSSTSSSANNNTQSHSQPAFPVQSQYVFPPAQAQASSKQRQPSLSQFTATQFHHPSSKKTGVTYTTAQGHTSRASSVSGFASASYDPLETATIFPRSKSCWSIEEQKINEGIDATLNQLKHLNPDETPQICCMMP